MTCGAPHPERALACESVGTHADHAAWVKEEGHVFWPNDDYVAPPPPVPAGRGRGAAQARLHGLAQLVPAKGARPEPTPALREEAVARATDPSTSHEAARSVGDLTEKQRHVLDVLRAASQPLTDEEIHAVLCRHESTSMSTSGARTRRAELVDGGLVEDSGLRGRTENDRPSIRWKAV